MSMQVGPIGLTYHEAYDAAKAYPFLAMVSDDGNTYIYIALEPAAGKPLPVWPAYKTTHWALLAKRGEELNLRLTDTAIEWRLTGGEWQELMPIAEMTRARDEAVAAAAAAKTSETQSKASETAAKTSETNAKTSETAAKASETKAKTSETNAKTSETNAKASETASKSSETKAKTSETNAKTSETAAKTSETNAKASETVAAQKVNSITGMTAEASTLEPGTEVTVNAEMVGEVLKLSFGIPRGRDGEGSGDMHSSVYDKDGDGVVDRAKTADTLSPTAVIDQSQIEGLTEALEAATPDNLVLSTPSEDTVDPIEGVDATRLDGVDKAYLLDRANHTGIQTIGTVAGLQAALDGKSDTTHTHSQLRSLFVSTDAPTTSDGQNGDLWIVVERNVSGVDDPPPDIVEVT